MVRQGNYDKPNTHDPMKARRIGQAARPGTDAVTCRLIDIGGGGRLKADHIATTKADITLITELELPDYAVPDFRTTMKNNGLVATLAPSLCITKKDDKIQGRRAGILTKAVAGAEIPFISPEDDLSELVKSGRWVEVQIPLGKGNHFVTLACFYGLAGKSPAERIINERLLSQALSRATADPEAPYLLFTDANTSVEKSNVIAMMLKS